MPSTMAYRSGPLLWMTLPHMHADVVIPSAGMPTRLLVSQAAGGRISSGAAVVTLQGGGKNPMAWQHGVLESSVVHNPVHRRDMLLETTSERPD